jgi:hypothetical protein
VSQCSGCRQRRGATGVCVQLEAQTVGARRVAPETFQRQTPHCYCKPPSKQVKLKNTIFWGVKPYSRVTFTDLQQEHTASIFTLLACTVLLFDPQERGSIFIRNLGIFTLDYAASYRTVHKRLCENSKCHVTKRIMTTYERVEAQLHIFFILTLGADQWRKLAVEHAGLFMFSWLWLFIR